MRTSCPPGPRAQGGFIRRQPLALITPKRQNN